MGWVAWKSGGRRASRQAKGAPVRGGREGVLRCLDARGGCSVQAGQPYVLSQRAFLGLRERLRERPRERLREGLSEGLREGVRDRVREGVKKGLRDGLDR